MFFPPLPPDAEDAIESNIDFHFEDVSFELPSPDRLAAWLMDVADEEERPFYEVNFIFCSDEYLRQVNIRYLEHDYFTHVITFPIGEPGEVSGHIFISSERVADNAAAHGVSFLHELCRVMVHGVLHLAGFGDKTPEEATLMREKEDFYLQKLSSDLPPTALQKS